MCNVGPGVCDERERRWTRTAVQQKAPYSGDGTNETQPIL